MFVTLHHFELHNIKENQCFDNLIWKGCRNSHHYESQQRGMEKMVIFKQQSLESRGRCKVDASATLSSNKPQLHNCYVALQNIFSWGYDEEWKILGVKRNKGTNVGLGEGCNKRECNACCLGMNFFHFLLFIKPPFLKMKGIQDCWDSPHPERRPQFLWAGYREEERSPSAFLCFITPLLRKLSPGTGMSFWILEAARN